MTKPKKKTDEVDEGVASEENVSADGDHTSVEGEYNLRLSKPSYIQMGRSLITPSDLEVLKRLGYIEDEDLIQFADEETSPESKKDEIIIYKSFF